ncbi:hypothetical protein FH972_024238 [Carpinus fangiana]|uniref:Uncharacterized protein n=1 Tax=Carpinus fangiana TaxID=176857 RepID=A0A5N6KXW8_9ROSI|nr:hypothetical protein FH972_024238 [Carpinus fangiana]
MESNGVLRLANGTAGGRYLVASPFAVPATSAAPPHSSVYPSSAATAASSAHRPRHHHQLFEKDLVYSVAARPLPRRLPAPADPRKDPIALAAIRRDALFARRHLQQLGAGAGLRAVFRRRSWTVRLRESKLGGVQSVGWM